MTETATLSLENATWLEDERGIPAELAARLGVVTINGRLAFEYRRNGKLQYRKMRIPMDDGKSYARDRKGAEACLFLEDLIETDPDLSQPLYICEGELDAIALKAAGFSNVVSVPDGAQLDREGEGKIDPNDDKAFGWLWDGPKLKACIDQFERIVLCTDADRKGRVLQQELAVRLDRSRCYFVTYPLGLKDANEVLVSEGAEDLAKIIAEAKPIVPDKLVKFTDIQDHGPLEVYSSGFGGLDDHLNINFVIPEFVVISGMPSSGKSEFSAILGANLAHRHQLPGAILQFEDRSLRVRETLTNYAISHVDGVRARTQARGWLDKWFRTIEPDQNLDLDVDYDLEWIASTLKEARTRHGCRWVIIDPWNELSHIFDGRSQNETVYTNEALRKIKRLSRALQMIIIVVTHPTKEGGQAATIDELNMYCINGSAAWANKADHMFLLLRPDKSQPEVFVKVAKAKDQTVMGVPGIVRMTYKPAAGRYDYVGMGNGLAIEQGK